MLHNEIFDLLSFLDYVRKHSFTATHSKAKSEKNQRQNGHGDDYRVDVDQGALITGQVSGTEL